MLYEQTDLYFEINFNIKIAYISFCGRGGGGLRFLELLPGMPG